MKEDIQEVLERKFDNALEILKTKDTELSQSDLLSWPIFKELREKENFKNYMNEKYPRPLKIENVKSPTGVLNNLSILFFIIYILQNYKNKG